MNINREKIIIIVQLFVIVFLIIYGYEQYSTVLIHKKYVDTLAMNKLTTIENYLQSNEELLPEITKHPSSTSYVKIMQQLSHQFEQISMLSQELNDISTSLMIAKPNEINNFMSSITQKISNFFIDNTQKDISQSEVYSNLDRISLINKSYKDVFTNNDNKHWRTIMIEIFILSEELANKYQKFR